MPAEIRAFFDSYRDAFNRLDGRAVTAHYQLPSMISSHASAGLFQDIDALMANNDALCQIYREGGFVDAHYSENTSLEQGDNFFLADLAWTIQTKSGPAQQFNTTYQLARRATAVGASEWKIEHVTAYSEVLRTNAKVQQ